MIRRITIIRRQHSPRSSINDELQWLASSLGLFGLRDKDSSCFRVFIELIKSSKINQPVSSDELAYKLDLSRGTVVHHLNKMIDSGLAIGSKRRYSLRAESLTTMVEALERDTLAALELIKKVAKEIDIELKK